MTWFASLDPDALFLSCLTLGELHRGVTQLEAKDLSRARELHTWVDELGARYADRILDVDLVVVRVWADLPSARTAPGIDSLLTATAAAHDLVLATRNVKDVADLGVPVVDPWQRGR